MLTRCPAVAVLPILCLCALIVTSGCQKVKEPPPEPVLQPNAEALPAPTSTDVDANIPTGNGETIGVSLLTKTHGFYQDLEAGMMEAARRLNYKLAVVSAEFKASEQDRQIDDFLVQKVAAIVVCPAAG